MHVVVYEEQRQTHKVVVVGQKAVVEKSQSNGSLVAEPFVQLVGVGIAHVLVEVASVVVVPAE